MLSQTFRPVLQTLAVPGSAKSEYFDFAGDLRQAFKEEQSQAPRDEAGPHPKAIHEHCHSVESLKTVDAMPTRIVGEFERIHPAQRQAGHGTILETVDGFGNIFK